MDENQATGAGSGDAVPLAPADPGPPDAAAQLRQLRQAAEGNAHALVLLAAWHEADGALDEALQCLHQAVAADGAYAQAYRQRGSVLLQSGRAGEALDDLDTAIRLAPDDAVAHAAHAQALQALGRPELALDSLDRALALRPQLIPAHRRRAALLVQLGRHEAAIASLDRVLAATPDDPVTLVNRGAALLHLRRPHEALDSLDRALSAQPGLLQAQVNRGVALAHLQRLPEALQCFALVLQSDPYCAAAHAERGAVFLQMHEHEQALACFDAAIASAPELAEPHIRRAIVLRRLGRPAQALESQGRALALDPGHPFARGDWLGLKAQVCDWAALPEEIAALEAALRRGEPATPPFPALGLIDDPALQRAAAQTWCAVRHPTPAVPRAHRRASRDDARIRVAYCSADFHGHATAWLLAEVLESHDATRFECWGLCFGPPRDDDMRRRIAGALHGFVDISRLSDRDAAALAHDIGVDIAVDLKGHTLDARPGLFAARCAPVQVSYLGYPGTTGAPFIDYLIADETVVPPQELQHYTEKVAYLPGCYQANDSQRRISPRAWSRAELGLPEDAFVYCCFNAPYKILPAVFDAWMRVLRAVPRAVLWLYEDNAAAAANLRREAAARGIAPSRLVFAPPMVVQEHLARYRCADLFLDTLPCNGHTTASDALWAGVPVLTLQGRSFAARVAASLLQALGLAELVMHSLADYEALAVVLAADRSRLSALAQRLHHARHASGVFDGRLTARRLEAAYAAMHRRQLLGLPPAHLGPDGLPWPPDPRGG